VSICRVKKSANLGNEIEWTLIVESSSGLWCSHSWRDCISIQYEWANVINTTLDFRENVIVHKIAQLKLDQLLARPRSKCNRFLGYSGWNADSFSKLSWIMFLHWIIINAWDLAKNSPQAGRNLAIHRVKELFDDSGDYSSSSEVISLVHMLTLIWYGDTIASSDQWNFLKIA
jgi:hypothetical protein